MTLTTLRNFTKAVIINIAITSFLLFATCSEDSPTNSLKITYKYSGYDSSWNKIISGYLWIDSIDSLRVLGRWDFILVGSEDNPGPQVGKGAFEGTSNMLGTLNINLNPEWIDNNVFLNGSTRLPNRLDGRWSYVGFPGVINWGHFEATQLR